MTNLLRTMRFGQMPFDYINNLRRKFFGVIKIKSDLLLVSLDSIIYHKIDTFTRMSESVFSLSIVPTLPEFLKELYG